MSADDFVFWKELSDAAGKHKHDQVAFKSSMFQKIVQKEKLSKKPK